MASWQAKQRDPLFDQSTQAALERRGKELLGFGLIVLGLLIALMLASYLPEDPSFMSATDQPAQNHLGRPGAYLARDGQDGNPGRNFIRVALVAAADQTEAALNRLKNCLYQGG